MPRIIGLTGGIATGKSTVSSIWSEAGVPIIDADKVAREVVQPGKPAYRLIRGYFGPSILNADGTLNRRELGAQIFSDGSKRNALNKRIHPFIVLSMLSKLFIEVFIRFRPIVVLDAPLLFESGTLRPFCSSVVVVACSTEEQIERMVRRDEQKGIDHAEARRRIASQMALSEKIDRADVVIENSQGIDQLKDRALGVLNDFEPSNTGELAFRALLCGVALKIVSKVISAVKCSQGL